MEFLAMKRQTSLQDLVRLASSLAQNLFVGSLPLSQNKEVVKIWDWEEISLPNQPLE